MAFTNAPTVATYSTKRINFVSNPQQRGTSSSTDAKMVNVLIEEIGGLTNSNPKYYTRSRPGMSQTYTTTSGTGRGIYTWNVSGTFYAMSVVGSSVYSNGTFLQTLTTSTGPCGFTEFVDASGVVTLVLVDGTKGYVFSSPTVAGTLIADVDFPSPHVPHPIFLDGYLFLAKANTTDVYNSDLNNPAAWTAGSFVSAEMYPDKIVGLARNNNYIYAIGSTSVEYFFDAANATGSPLSREPTAVQEFGTPAPYATAATDKEVVIVGSSGSGGQTIYTLDGFKAKDIATPAVRSSLLGEGASLASASAFTIRVSSQKLYVLCLTSRTWVYSFDTKIWTEWEGVGGIAFPCRYASEGPAGAPYLQHTSNGKVLTMSETIFTDDGSNFTVTLITQKLDFETMNRKTASRLVIVGDVPDSALVDSAVSVSWTDDDYVTYSTARTLTFNADLPQLKQLGMFRRRAFKLVYSLPHLFRIEGVELDINKGTA